MRVPFVKSPLADPAITLGHWHRGTAAGTFDPLEVPENRAVVVSINGEGTLLASDDGENFTVAIDTAGLPVSGACGARHLPQPSPRWLMPQVNGIEKVTFEVCVSEVK